MVRISTIRPGYLVSLKSSISGNIRYATTDIVRDHVDDDGVRRAKWETQRAVQNPAEWEAAVKVRGKARSLITAVCAPSSFGLLCPEDRGEDLSSAIEAARQLCDEFNRTAAITQISLFTIAGKVAANDQEAVRAINSEMRDLMDAMESGLKRLDATAVREAAQKARALGSMLSEAASARMQAAIGAARSAARQIVKAGDGVAIAIDEATLRAVREGRMAFLDLDEGEAVQAPEATARVIEMDPEGDPPIESVGVRIAPALAEGVDLSSFPVAKFPQMEF